MRLHQPHRPLQPTQPRACSSVIPPSCITFRLMSTFRFLVRPTRIRSACLPRFVFPAVRPVDSAHAESTASSVQCPKVRQPYPLPLLCIPLILPPFAATKIFDLTSVPRVMSQSHIYDATEIFRTLPQHKKESFIKLGFYLISFFYYLYRYICALL